MKYVKMIQKDCPYQEGSYRNRAWYTAKACHGLPVSYLVRALSSVLRDADGGSDEWVVWLVRQGVLETPNITEPPTVDGNRAPKVRHAHV